MEELEEVNKKIELLKAAEWQRIWRKNNPEKKRKQNAEWNAKNRNKYQREYRAKNQN